MFLRIGKKLTDARMELDDMIMMIVVVVVVAVIITIITTIIIIIIMYVCEVFCPEGRSVP